MTVIKAIILGLVQGLTEFLPVSSSGHIVLAARILKTGPVSVGFELVCHLGTLIALFTVMHRELISVIKKPFSREGRLIIIAVAATALTGGIISAFFNEALKGSALVYGFAASGIMLLLCGFIPNKESKPLTYPHAAVIGLFQGIAALPGLSRSGTTVAAAQALGYDKEQSVRFSFIISVPVIIGSLVVELIVNGLGACGIYEAIAAFVASLLSGLISVKFMLKFVKNHDLTIFAVYLMMLSAFMVINDFALCLF